jgi:DNA-binding transcriptional regulator YiaG
MPFGHLKLVAYKPKNNSYLWKASRYPHQPKHFGEQIKKHRFDLKMTAVECRKILGIGKSTLLAWEQARHKPSPEHLNTIIRFLRK